MLDDASRRNEIEPHLSEIQRNFMLGVISA